MIHNSTNRRNMLSKSQIRPFFVSFLAISVTTAFLMLLLPPDLANLVVILHVSSATSLLGLSRSLPKHYLQIFFSQLSASPSFVELPCVVSDRGCAWKIVFPDSQRETIAGNRRTFSAFASFLARRASSSDTRSLTIVLLMFTSALRPKTCSEQRYESWRAHLLAM